MLSRFPTGRIFRRALPGAVSVLGFALASSANAATSFFVDQVVNYGGTCEQPDLFDDTYYIVSRMQSAGWTGLKFVDANAWPQDFREACSTQYGSGGLDSYYADNYLLAIFSGHGSPNQLYFGAAHNGACNHFLGPNGRLGSMSGSKAGVALYFACDVLNLETIADGANWQWLRQQLGFYDLVGNETIAYADFFDATADHWDYSNPFFPQWVPAKPNADAWLDELWYEQAISVTYSNYSGSDCWYVYDNAKLKANMYNSARLSPPACGQNQPVFYWCANWN